MHPELPLNCLCSNCSNCKCNTQTPTDHIYTDAALAKINFRWRTALIIRELEDEVVALAKGRRHRAQLMELIAKKASALVEDLQGVKVKQAILWLPKSLHAPHTSDLEVLHCLPPVQETIGALFDHLRLARQRALAGRAPGVGGRGALARSGSKQTAATRHLAGADGLGRGGFDDEAAVNETLGQVRASHAPDTDAWTQTRCAGTQRRWGPLQTELVYKLSL